MIFVKRDASGAVVAISRCEAGTRPPGDAWSAAERDDADVLEFARSLAASGNPLAPTDLGLVRVIEDLVDLLVDRAVIRFTDLPLAAQLKLMERRGAREAMHRSILLDDDDVI